MPRLDVPLTGWQQTPDERSGPPRIARLINAQLDNAGRILKSPGQVALSQSSPDGAITAPVAFGDTFEVFRGAASAQQGFRLAAHDGSQWHYHTRESDYVSPVEAPRLRAIFNEPSSHYERPHVLDVGGGDYVVVAERLANWALGGADPLTDPQTHDPPTCVWALLSGDDDLRVVARGEFSFTPDGVTPSADARAMLTADGLFIAGWYTVAHATVWRWSAANRTFEMVSDVNLTTYTTNHAHLELLHLASQDRVFLADASGSAWWINATTGATVGSGSLGSFGAAIVEGTVTACVDSLSRIYVAARTTATAWVYRVVQWSGSAWTAVSGPTLICNSPTDVFEPAYGALRAEMCLDTATNQIIAAVPVRDYAAGPSLAGVALTETRLVRFAVGVTPVEDEIARYRQHVTRPVWDSSSGPVYWAVNSHPTMTLRHAELRGAGYLGTTGTAAKTAVCVAGDPGNTLHYAFLGAAGRMVRSAYLPPMRAGVRRSGWIAALPVLRSANGYECDVHVAIAADGWTLESAPGANLPDLFATADAGASQIIASGVPVAYGSELEPTGFLAPPPPPSMSAVLGAYSIPAGTYYYVTALRYITATEDVIWSPVSDVATVTNASNAYHTGRAYADNAVPAMRRATLHLFRSVGGVYYEVDFGVPQYPTGAQDAAGVEVQSLGTDAEVIANAPRILYTQGANGAVSGALDRFGCPPCRCIAASPVRAIAGGLAKENRVRWSNLFFPTEGVSWPEHAAFYADVSEPVTAVAALSDAWIVASETTIWVVTGEGPDQMGAGTFNAPQRLTSGIGIPTWRSMVHVPEGILFQGNDGQIYMLAAGSFQVSPISQGIRDSLGQVAPASDPADPTIWVQGAAYDQFTREAWFATSVSEWVLQRESGTWRQEVATHQSAALLGVYALDTPAYRGPVVVRAGRAYRPRRRSESDVYLDATGATRTMSIETSDVDLVHGRFIRGYVKTAREVNSAVSLATQAFTLRIWFDGSERSQNADETQLINANASATATRFHEIEFAPARQKCNQFRIRISDVPDVYTNLAWHVLGLTLEVEQTKQRPIRYATGTGRMT